MSQHTPGPWGVVSGGLWGATVRVHRVGLIPPGARYAIASMGVGRGDDEDHANAHLIAAAPDLLQVLSDMVEMMDSGDEHGAGSAWYAEAKAAIAKARGQ